MAIRNEKGELSYEGKVLCTREENGYHDSDFYAVVWNEEEKALKKVYYASTRHAGGGSATPDATEAVIEKAREWMEGWLYRAYIREAQNEAKKIKKGSMVKVIRGRKVEHGTVGKVFWLEERSYGHHLVVKIGIALDDEKDERGWHKNVAWTYLDNVMLVEQPQINYHDLKEKAKTNRGRVGYHIPFALGHYAVI